MFIRLSLFQKTLYINWNRFKQTTSTWYWSKAIQYISFTGNLERDGNRTMFFIIEEAKETILNFSEGTVTVF